MRMEVRQGDITQQPDMDAIVNAANTDLALGAGVAGAIRRRGGDEIDRDARAQGPIKLGAAVATSAGRLPNRWVIHAAAMGYRAEDDLIPKRAGSLSSAAIIRQATLNSLQRAEEAGARSIASSAGHGRRRISGGRMRRCHDRGRARICWRETAQRHRGGGVCVVREIRIRTVSACAGAGMKCRAVGDGPPRRGWPELHGRLANLPANSQAALFGP